MAKQRYERHGMTGTQELNIWRQMIRRCCNPRCPSYAEYGARGIRVCEKWRNSFTAFYLDMGKLPSPHHTLDRYPNKIGHYEPTNCRWATRKQQARNTTTNRELTLNGVTRSIAEWAEYLKIPIQTLYSRWRLNLTTEEILNPALRHKHKGNYTNGVFHAKKEERHGFRYRRKHGLEKAWYDK